MLTGTATTNSSEDVYGRVKVSCSALWEKESTLLPVMNNIFISKGDEVILFSPENLMQSTFILGKFQTKAVQDSDPVDTKSKQVLFKAHVDGSFIIGTLNEGLLHIETNSVTVDIDKDSVSVKTAKDINVESTGGKVIVNGGSNDGAVNVKDVRELVQALAKDLMIAQSGVNLSAWMATGMVSIEDTKFTH